MAKPKVLVLGVSGLVGFAAAKRFAADPRFEVVGAARRRPLGLPEEVELRSIDLLDEGACRSQLADVDDITHVVYAALYEEPGLIAGWRSEQQMATNLAMLRNILTPLLGSCQN